MMLFRATYSRCCGLNGQNGCDNSKWTRWIGDLYSYCSAYMNFLYLWIQIQFSSGDYNAGRKWKMKDFSFWKEYEGTSEGSGRGEKIWLQNPDTGQTGLFKFKKDAGTTDHISECIAYKIAKLLEKGERDQCEELFPVFSSRLPDKKEKILKNLGKV